MYNLEGPILKTLYRKPDTHRVRDLRPGEDVQSIYDEINHKDTRFFHTKHNPKDQTMRKTISDTAISAPRNFFYNGADVLEDEILFPEEKNEKISNPSNVRNLNAMQKWEGDNFSMGKWVEGNWDSDWTEFSDSDEEEINSEEDLDHGAMEKGDTEDEDDEWEDEDEGEGEGMVNSIMTSKLQEQPKQSLTTERLIRAMGLSKEFEEAMLAIMKKDAVPPIDPTSPEDFFGEFMLYMEKEKSRREHPTNSWTVS
jgi:hypothetical protein